MRYLVKLSVSSIPVKVESTDVQRFSICLEVVGHNNCFTGAPIRQQWRNIQRQPIRIFEDVAATVSPTVRKIWATYMLENMVGHSDYAADCAGSASLL